MSKHSDAFCGAVIAIIAFIMMLLMWIEFLIIDNFSIVGFAFLAVVLLMGIKMALDDL